MRYHRFRKRNKDTSRNEKFSSGLYLLLPYDKLAVRIQETKGNNTMNINEIASLAGVSRATVSRFLNNGYVSEEKRQRIKKVIDETGYRPSAQAQTLRTKKTNLVGVIIPKINSDSIGRMVAGISLVLSQAGYQLLLANTDNNEKEEIKYLKVLAEKQVDGIILIGTVITGAHKKLLAALSIPAVILSQRLSGYSCVYYDDFQAARELTALLLETGTNVAYIGVTDRDEAAGRQRREGFLMAFEDCGKTAREELFSTGEFTMEAGRGQAEKLFSRYPEIDSVFCATDSIAVGVISWLQDQGKKIPEEVQIAGIGDSQISRVCVPRLATVHYYYKTSGQEAAKLLVDIMSGNSDARREIRMGYRLIPGKSTRE